jgi:TonB family protein
MRTLLLLFFAQFSALTIASKNELHLVFLDPVKEIYIDDAQLTDENGRSFSSSENGLIVIDSKDIIDRTWRVSHPNYMDSTFQLDQLKGMVIISLRLNSNAMEKWNQECCPDFSAEYKNVPLDIPDSSAYFQTKDLRELMRYISRNVNYPQYAIEHDFQGKVYLQFVIDSDGSVKYVSIVKGKSTCLDRESIRVISNMPKWIPAYKDGKPVPSIYRLPINFTMQ